MVVIGNFGEVASNYFDNSDSFLNIAYGAVRSGKTIVATFRFLEHVFRSEHDKFLICGKSRDTIRRNILYDMFDILENTGQVYSFNYVHGEVRAGGNIFYVIGLNDEKATDKLKGMTVGGALLDEVTTVPRSSFEMLLTRCSLPGSKIFATTNPDSPYHWLYTDYIANESIGEEYLKTWKFEITDNPHLSEDYIKTQKQLNSHSSAHYRRNILGEWAMAEGRIYEHFNEDNIINDFKDLPERFDALDIGTDYGVTNPNCFVLVGTVYDEEEGNKYYCLDMIYHDPAVKGYRQTDKEKIADIQSLIHKWKDLDIDQLILPHDAASLYEEASRAEELNELIIETFKPNTNECIGVVSDLIYENNLLVYEPNCKELIKQIESYVWDIKKAKRGADGPLEANDHAVDAIRGPIMFNRKVYVFEPLLANPWGKP